MRERHHKARLALLRICGNAVEVVGGHPVLQGGRKEKLLTVVGSDGMGHADRIALLRACSKKVREF